MAKYILKRVIAFVPVLFFSSIFIFFMVRLTGADPITSLQGTQRLSDESRAALTREFHLDKSLPEQYFIWVGGMFRGKFPVSFKYRQPVDRLIASRLSATLQLVGMSFVFAFFFAITLGLTCAAYRNGAVDRVLSAVLVLFASTPPFLLAVVLILIFSLRLGWFPSFGAGHSFRENLCCLLLPSLSLGAAMMSLMGRVTRSRMIEELDADYVRTEIAKGTPRHVIMFRHCLEGALIPVVTIGGLQLGGAVVGAVLIENVFALGGVGDLLVTGIKSADYPVQSIVILMTGLCKGEKRTALFDPLRHAALPA
ncbi:MAG: ABC transporter permease [Synergistaceae bacterium]|jgi:peptide/nickel transport system permease protein|nr:ABC transporter permease [Synergistaceae bacterium]